MEPIPTDWIDKIFTCMAHFYGEKWSKAFEKPNVESFYKMVWKNGLYGLTRAEIRNALIYCQRAARDVTAIPPHVSEFFRCAKGEQVPYINYSATNDKRCDPEVARKHLADMRRATQAGRMDSYGRLSA